MPIKIPKNANKAFAIIVDKFLLHFLSSTIVNITIGTEIIAKNKCRLVEGILSKYRMRKIKISAYKNAQKK